MERSTAAICTSARFAGHLTGPHHPERPDRIRAIARALRTARLVDSPDPFPDFVFDPSIPPTTSSKLLELPEPDDQTEPAIRLIHDDRYIRRVRETSARAGVLDQGDTPTCPASEQIARLGVGAVLRCCDAVAGGTALRAFAAVRPPGHHAEPDRPMGFCLYSNVAIGARYLQKQHGVGRIAIVDFDVHHGNGTQAAFETDPTVLFISLHQDPRTCYPGSGYAWETGHDAGAGYTLNLPFPPGSGDDAYLARIDREVLPAIDRFKPELLLLSAGFDAHRDDPLAQMELSDDGFSQITQRLTGAANLHCQGRIVSCLEGGYHLQALARSVVRHLQALQE